MALKYPMLKKVLGSETILGFESGEAIFEEDGTLDIGTVEELFPEELERAKRDEPEAPYDAVETEIWSTWKLLSKRAGEDLSRRWDLPEGLSGFCDVTGPNITPEGHVTYDYNISVYVSLAEVEHRLNLEQSLEALKKVLHPGGIK